MNGTRKNSIFPMDGRLIFSVMVAFMIGASLGIIFGSEVAYGNAKDTILMLNERLSYLNQSCNTLILPDYCHRVYNESGGIFCDLGG